jgi:NAD(P)-dependent dehydrogenase (short-subunit alcohol dehydrogenase family)
VEEDMAESLKGKTAVISAVGSGFAKATAELFAAKDQCNLVLIEIDQSALDDTVKKCEAAGSKVVAIQGDVTKKGTFEQARKLCMDNFGRIDFLINYAGGAGRVAPIEEMDDETNQKIIDLNLKSVIMSCREFTPIFKEQKAGKIFNVSSVCDRRSWPGWSVYSAAKAGVNAFTKCLYTELRPHNVAVGLIVPGGANTGFQGAAEGVDDFEWDDNVELRPEHFADMVYQACALSMGGCISELHIYGLAQNIEGF